MPHIAKLAHANAAMATLDQKRVAEMTPQEYEEFRKKMVRISGIWASVRGPELRVGRGGCRASPWRRRIAPCASKAALEHATIWDVHWLG